MKVGQRAYLEIESGSARLSTSLKAKPAFPLPSTADGIAMFYYDLVIRNLGRTPARVVDYTLQFSTPPGWSVNAGSNDLESPTTVRVTANLGGIPQDGKLVAKDKALLFWLTKDAVAATRPDWRPLANPRFQFRTATAMTVLGTLSFVDVFGDVQQVRWCWIVTEATTLKCESLGEVH